MSWTPEKFDKDPQVNAILNVAAALNRLAAANEELLYGLKHGKNSGLSLAESIEVGAKSIASSLEAVGENLRDR